MCQAGKQRKSLSRFGDALKDDLGQQRMRPERLGEKKLNVRESGGQSVAGGRQVATDMHAGRKEVRQQNDAMYFIAKAIPGPGIDIRLGQLQVGGFDDGESAGLSEF